MNSFSLIINCYLNVWTDQTLLRCVSAVGLLTPTGLHSNAVHCLQVSKWDHKLLWIHSGWRPKCFWLPVHLDSPTLETTCLLYGAIHATNVFVWRCTCNQRVCSTPAFFQNHELYLLESFVSAQHHIEKRSSSTVTLHNSQSVKYCKSAKPSTYFFRD